jgi:hypothetical protein
MEILDVFWNGKFLVFQIVTCLFVLEAPSLLRRVTKVAYVPLYFSFIPLGHSDSLYAEYLDEGFLGGSDMNEAESNRLKNKIVSYGYISIIFSFLFVPWTAGAILSSIVAKEVVMQTLVIFVVWKAYAISKGIIQWRLDTVVFRGSNLILVVLLYVSFLFAVVVGTLSSFDWFSGTFRKLGTLGTLSHTAKTFYDFVVGQGIIFTLLGAALMHIVNANALVKNKDDNSDKTLVSGQIDERP